MKERQNKGSNLVKQGAILAIAGIITKFIGFIFKIPLQDIIGNEGYAYYNQGFSIYNVLLIVSAYGVPMALSKIISEKNALGKYDEADQVLKVTSFLTIVLSFVTSLFMWFGADYIALIFNTPEVANTLRALSPTLALMPFLFIMRGYFQGHHTMVPTAISQIIEQILNALGGLFLAYLLVDMSVDLGAAGATLGTTLGAFFAIVFLAYLFFNYRKKEKKHKANSTKSQLSNKEILKEILYVIVPITIVAALSSIVNLLDTAMFPWGMAYHGAENIKEIWGLYTGKFMLLTNFPIAIATALSAATIPSIAASMVRKDFNIAKIKMNKVIKIITIIALPAAVGLTVLAEPILLTVYGSGDFEPGQLAIATNYFRIGSSIVYFFSIFQITNAVLQGMHQVKEPVKNMLIAGSIKIILNIVFLFGMGLSAEGLIYSSIVFSILLTVLNIRSIYRFSDVRFNWSHLLIKPIISCVVMGILSWLAYRGAMALTSSVSISSLIGIGIGAGSYFVVLLLIKGINREELTLIPYGDKLADILKIK
ncbi:putative polysaccharide biosynthesis protein [Vallitalea okinawensis]|uniref:putative polysaccharide biosynthesis protein n=1 Tax=Vallitalea okinawensis TaxID=2078660 RepID=UPI000CFDA234|nr:polysaccharide biosynthesis protein [Vallitalea okinawensis]